MVDLFIDWQVLARTQGRLRRIGDLLEQPCRKLAVLPAEAVGQERLRQQMRNFGDQWSYGIGKLGEYAGAAEEALEKIKEGFENVDNDLLAAIEGEG